MTTRVLIVGLERSLIDFSQPAYAAHPGLDAEKVRGSLEADATHLNGLGYEVEICLTDFGDTAETVHRQSLERRPVDCLVIGAGVRLNADNTPLFEKLVNVVHVHAPQAKLCFDTRPSDTAEAVERWFRAGGTPAPTLRAGAPMRGLGEGWSGPSVERHLSPMPAGRSPSF